MMEIPGADGRLALDCWLEIAPAFPWGRHGGGEAKSWLGCPQCCWPEVKATSHFPRAHQAVCEAFIGLINPRKYIGPKVR